MAAARLRRRLAQQAMRILAACCLPFGAAAQGGLSTEGGLFLLLPVGGRAVGMGQAAAASTEGSESVWWNPAGLATAQKREAAIHHSQSLLGTGDALTLVVPSRLLGTLAVSIDVLNYGEFPITDSLNTDVPLGTIIPRNVVYAVTYASGVGRRMGIGLTYKVVQLRFDCSGPCPPSASYTATTSAVDFGVRARFSSHTGAGAALRHLGLPFQVNDSQQADPLPTRLHLGVAHSQPLPLATVPVQVLFATDLVENLDFTSHSLRFGVDLSYDRRFHLRGGYVLEQGDAGGPSVGFGVTAGNFVIDFGSLVGGLAAEQGQSPTHLSLRFLF